RRHRGGRAAAGDGHGAARGARARARRSRPGGLCRRFPGPCRAGPAESHRGNAAGQPRTHRGRGRCRARRRTGHRPRRNRPAAGHHPPGARPARSRPAGRPDAMSTEKTAGLHSVPPPAAPAAPRPPAAPRVPRVKQLELLLEVSRRLMAFDSLDDMLHALVDMTTTQLGAERGSLFLNDPGTNELYSRVAQGNIKREIRMLNTSGIAGHVFTSGEPLISHEPYTDPRFNSSVDEQTGFI